MKNKSFTLIELMIAVFVIAVGTVGAFTVLQKVIVSTTLSSSRLTASYLAQEGIEIVRNIRDTNWIENKSWTQNIGGCGGGCEADYDDTALSSWGGDGSFLEINSKGFYSYDPGVETKFRRKIIVDETSGEKLEVTVEVFWEERGKTHQVVVQENLYDWFEI